MTLGSSAGTSTSVFGSQTYQIRLATTGSAGMVKYVIGDTPVTSTAAFIGQNGSNLPPGVIEHVTVTPGQQLVAISTTTSALATITECGA